MSIVDFMQEYCSSFKPGNLETILGHYHTPVTMVYGNFVLLLNNQDEIASVLTSGLDDLQDKGFSHSRYDSLSYQVVSDTTAFVSAVFTRYAEEQTLEQLAATYTLVRDEDSWKIAQVVVHEANKALTLAHSASL